MRFATRSDRSSPRRVKNTSVLTPRHRARSRHESTPRTRPGRGPARRRASRPDRAHRPLHDRPAPPLRVRGDPPERHHREAGLGRQLRPGPPGPTEHHEVLGGPACAHTPIHDPATQRPGGRRTTRGRSAAWPPDRSGTDTRVGRRRGRARHARVRSTASGACRPCGSGDARRRCRSPHPTRRDDLALCSSTRSPAGRRPAGRHLTAERRVVRTSGAAHSTRHLRRGRGAPAHGQPCHPAAGSPAPSTAAGSASAQRGSGDRRARRAGDAAYRLAVMPSSASVAHPVTRRS